MHKDCFDSYVGNHRIPLRDELEYALETTTLFGQTSPPKRSPVVRNLAHNSSAAVLQIAPVMQPEYYQVPANPSYCSSVRTGAQTLIYSNVNHASNMGFHELNFYQPATPFLVPSSLSHVQLYKCCPSARPTCTSVAVGDSTGTSSVGLHQYQPPQSRKAVNTTQKVVQVPETSRPTIVSDVLLKPSRHQSLPSVAPRRVSVFHKDGYVAENSRAEPGFQRIVNLRDLARGPIRKPRTNKGTAKMPYSRPSRSGSPSKSCSFLKVISIPDKHRVNLRNLPYKTGNQKYAIKTPAREADTTRASASPLKVPAPPKKKAKIEHDEDEQALNSMYELLAESTDLRGALARGEIRIEEHKTGKVTPSPSAQTTTTTSTDSETASHASCYDSSQSSSSDPSGGLKQKPIENKTAKPKVIQEELEPVSLEEIFSLDMSETQALLGDSFKDVDFDDMCDTYLCHEEPTVDENCLKEILESAEFAELFESIDGDDDTTDSRTALPNETHPPVEKQCEDSVEKPVLPPKTRSSMTIEELFLSNRERVLEMVATEQQQEQEQNEYQHGSIENNSFPNPPQKPEMLEVIEENTIDTSFPEYIPDMFLFSATDPEVRLDVFNQTVTAISGQAFIDEVKTPPLSDDCLKQPTGHYDAVPQGHLDMLRADKNVYREKVYRAPEGFKYIFHEFRAPGNDVIVDPATLQTPSSPVHALLGRKRPCSHDNEYSLKMYNDSQPTKKFKVDAGSWVTCSKSGHDVSDSVTSKKPKRCHNNKARNQTKAGRLPGEYT